VGLSVNGIIGLRRKMSKGSLTLLLVVSLIVAVGGLVQYFSFPLPDSIAGLSIRGGTPAVIWLFLFVVGLVVHGRRGFWLLIGAPFVLFIPIVLAAFFLICGTQFFPTADCP
jgi:hypothetical protein